MMEGQLNMWGNIFPPDILQILKDTITVCNEEAIEESLENLVSIGLTTICGVFAIYWFIRGQQN